MAACPAETLAASEGKVCKTCADVNASAPFWNPATEECVAKCLGPAVGKVCWACYNVDASKPYWSEASEQCMSCAEATKGA